MQYPIKIAQIIGRTNNGGVENYILNYYTNIDRTQVEFDFFISNECEIVNTKVVEKLGGNVVIIPTYKNVVKYEKALINALKQKKYDIVQANNNALSCLSLYAAKKAGYNIRIANSLSSTDKKEGIRYIIKNFLKLFSKKYATHYFACSDYAGKWLFGEQITENKNYYKVNNAVIIDNYRYNKEIRNELRQKHKLGDSLVIGTIGRLEHQKNYMFLLDVFAEVKKINRTSKLIIIGDGRQLNELKTKAKELKIDSDLLILGSRDVGVRGMASKYYSVFDAFLLPSLYEGLPTVGIEAQITNLPTVFSTSITSEAKINEQTIYIDLEKSPEEWAKEILKLISNTNRASNTNFKDHDISVQAMQLLKIYKKILEEKL